MSVLYFKFKNGHINRNKSNKSCTIKQSVTLCFTDVLNCFIIKHPGTYFIHENSFNSQKHS